LSQASQEHQSQLTKEIMLDLINLFRHAVISVGKEPKIIFERLTTAVQLTEAPTVTLIAGHIDQHGLRTANTTQKLSSELVKKFGIHSWVHSGSTSVGVREKDGKYVIILIDVWLQRLVEHVYINSDRGCRMDFLGNRIHVSITTVTPEPSRELDLETILKSVLGPEQSEKLTFTIGAKSTE
jgi:hypothetical protein